MRAGQLKGIGAKKHTAKAKQGRAYYVLELQKMKGAVKKKKERRNRLFLEYFDESW